MSTATKLTPEQLRSEIIQEALRLMDKKPELRWTDAQLQAKRMFAARHGMDAVYQAYGIPATRG